MKQITLVIVIFMVVLSLPGVQMVQGNKELTKSENSSLTVQDNLGKTLEIGASYLKKGIFYLTLAVVLLIIWLLLRYKI